MWESAQPRALARATMLILVLLAFAWRAWGLDSQSLWRDEVDALRFATRPWPELLAMFTRPGENGPLFFLLLRPWLAIAGHSEYALRFPSLMAGVVAVALGITLAGRLGAPHPARLVAGLLLATNPYLTWYSQEGKMYALITSLILASNLSFVEALRQGRLWRWALYWLWTTLCLYVHVLAALIIPVHLLWFLVGWPESRRRWRGYAAALAGLTLPYLPLGWWQLRMLMDSNFRPGFPFLPLDQMITVLLLAFGRGLAPIPGAWSIAPMLFLALAGVWMGDGLISASRAGRRLRPLAWLGMWLLLPVLELFAISLRVPLFTDRYLIWISPALGILAALGTIAIREYSRWAAAIVLGSVVALNLQAAGFQTHVPIKSDFRRAVAIVERQRGPGDAVMVIMPYVRHVYAYYATGEFPFVEPPYTNAGATPEQVDVEMRRRLVGWQGVWLVSSEEELWDQRGLVRAWLDAHGERLIDSHFTRVSVTYYRLNQGDEGNGG
ncbi:MAG: glycosyltransferase family 39 protein [Anaerolineae bacterium]|nr:glycosyltransferase family 39 protein [Anaerolineae bacterium]MDW8101089.1 glycosyltransferase family 39 protein [Anaerolineae bacterium]